MKLHHDKVLVLGAALLVGVVACEKRENTDQTQTTGATTSQPQSTSVQPTTSNTTPPVMVHPGPSADTVGRDLNDGTIDRLAEARCKRATACNDIGNGKKWNDEPACQGASRPQIYDEYKQNACHTVLTEKVMACVHAIQNEPCTSAFDIAQIAACRKDLLCKD